MKETFTFGIMSYNQEDTILETLESIKYQINKYGKDYCFRMIIGDDGSRDRTIKYIENWLEYNQELFEEIIFLPNKKNIGTAKNYIRMIDLIENSNFKIIAGDDIFSKHNLFVFIEDLKKYDIVSYLALGFTKGNIINITNDFNYFATINPKKYEKLIRRQNIFIAPATFYNMKLLNDNVKKFIKQFKLIEDYPLWIKVFEEQTIHCKFDFKFPVLYRISNQSVSHSKVNALYIEDRKKILKYLIKKEKNKIVMLYLFLSYLSFSIKLYYLQPIRYINKIILWKRKCQMFLNPKNKYYKEMIKKEINYNQIYLEKIIEQASKLRAIFDTVEQKSRKGI